MQAASPRRPSRRVWSRRRRRPGRMSRRLAHPDRRLNPAAPLTSWAGPFGRPSSTLPAEAKGRRKMTWLGWDWGNVPSWFSAASFSVAAGAFLRDRSIRRRQQVDQVSAWGAGFSSHDEEDDPLFRGYYVIANIQVKNSGPLAVHVSNISYQISAYWADHDEGALLGTYKTDPVVIEGQADGTTVPPGATLRAYDMKTHDILRSRPAPGAVVGMGVPGTAILVTQYMVIDSHGVGWLVRPTSGRPPKRLRRYRRRK